MAFSDVEYGGRRKSGSGWGCIGKGVARYYAEERLGSGSERVGFRIEYYGMDRWIDGGNGSRRSISNWGAVIRYMMIFW